MCVLHQFTLVDEKPKSPMSSLLKKLTGKQGKQNKTRDRNLRNFSVSSAEMCLQHLLCLLLVYSSLRQKWFPPLLVRSTEDVTEEMERQRKIKQKFLPLLLFSTKYLELFTSSWPRLPLQFHSLQFALHSGGDHTCLASAGLGWNTPWTWGQVTEPTEGRISRGRDRIRE